MGESTDRGQKTPSLQRTQDPITTENTEITEQEGTDGRIEDRRGNLLETKSPSFVLLSVLAPLRALCGLCG